MMFKNPVFPPTDDTSRRKQGTLSKLVSVDVSVIENHVFTEEGWKQISAPSHPQMRLRLTTCADDYSEFGIAFPKIKPKHIDVVVDSGA